MSQIATRGNRTPRPTRADININDFQFICTVGRGSWAKVSKVRLKSTGDVYALKSYSLKKIHEQKREEDILNEVRIHKTLNNTFIADLHYAFATKKKLYFVMDFAAGGDLFFHLQKNTTFTLEQTKFFVAEMILAVEYLHQRGIIKRALKPEDMGIDEHGHIKLFDIGLSCDGFTDYSVTTNTLCGTPEYVCLFHQTYSYT
jgi:serine/threonine protein kinase